MDIFVKTEVNSTRNERGSKNSSPYLPDLHMALDLDSQLQRPGALSKSRIRWVLANY